jgi:hypothetical protein
MTPESWTRQAKTAGLELVQHSPYHWQIRGGKFIVNYYPTKATIYVNQTASSRSHQIKGDFAKALRMANEIPPVGRWHPKRRKPEWTRRMKAKLLRKDPHCHLCGKSFANPREATIDHIIPLARGGSHGEDNLALACQRCNVAKGHDVAARIEAAREVGA